MGLIYTKPGVVSKKRRGAPITEFKIPECSFLEAF
jgi:hypothetical protein